MNEVDQKNRWGGFLENPFISRVQRNILDGGRGVQLKNFLSRYNFSSVVDIGCGLGETSEIFSCAYTGVDNSYPRVSYARNKYPDRNFIVGDACHLEFEDDVFDAGLMIDTSHHLTDQMFGFVLKEMVRVCRRYIIVSDPVYFEGQSFISRYFYSLDRGGCFRTGEEMMGVFQQIQALELDSFNHFMTFPWLYRHAIFVFELKKRPLTKT